MTLEQFNRYNKTKSMPYEWIGQGNGYKDTEFDWDNGNPTDIIYIPEYGYDGDTVKRENAFSKEDFIDICNGDEGDALYLFDSVDWQFPSSLYNELDWEKEEVD